MCNFEYEVKQDYSFKTMKKCYYFNDMGIQMEDLIYIFPNKYEQLCVLKSRLC